MKRAALALVATIAGLVFLLGAKTRPAGQSAISAAISTPTPGASATPKTQQPSTGTKTVTGNSVDTRYGPVQVRLTITNGTISNAAAIAYPQEQLMDQQINAQAVPILQQETVTAQNAHIDAVSGATFTSDGYIQSLQSALDKAGL